MNLDHLEVQCLQTSFPGFDPTTHIRVRRHDGQDGITWDELQEAKNQAGFSEETAIEIYPPADEVVYEINARHLWVVPWGVEVPTLWR